MIIFLVRVSDHRFNSFYHKRHFVKVGVTDVADCIENPMDIVEVSYEHLELLSVFTVQLLNF